MADKTSSRLPFWKATWVVSRRDFMTIVTSKSFLLFLFAPLLALIITGVSGSILLTGGDKKIGEAKILVTMSEDDSAKLVNATKFMKEEVDISLPEYVFKPKDEVDPRQRLSDKTMNLMVVLSGDLENPTITGRKNNVDYALGRLTVIIAEAQKGQFEQEAYPDIKAEYVTSKELGKEATDINEDKGTFLISKAVQFALYILTSTLAIMVLTNLIEEKSNKIIEILATAIPMEALFLGKLIGMLAVSAVALSVWTLFSSFLGSGLAAGMAKAGIDIEPMVGWLPFLALFVGYYMMSYFIFGSIYLTIGGMAPTPREAQVYTLPVSILQLMSFLYGAYATSAGGVAMWVGILIPLTSPYVLLGHAAETGGSYIYLLGFAWQALMVTLAIKLGAQIFRNRVLDQRPIFKFRTKKQIA